MVERYSDDYKDGVSGAYSYMREDKEGDFVFYEDYQTIEAERDAMKELSVELVKEAGGFQ